MIIMHAVRHIINIPLLHSLYIFLFSIFVLLWWRPFHYVKCTFSFPCILPHSNIYLLEPVKYGTGKNTKKKYTVIVRYRSEIKTPGASHARAPSQRRFFSKFIYLKICIFRFSKCKTGL